MSKGSFVSIYDSIAVNYDKKHGQSCIAAHTLLLDAIAQLPKLNYKILDVGCGTAEVLHKLNANPAFELFGLDPSHEMLKIAREKVPRAHYIHGVTEQIDLADASIDIVISSTSFSHSTDHFKALQEIDRVLKPGGWCFIAEHPKPNIVIQLILKVINRLPHFLSADEMTDLITSSPLTLSSIEIKDKFLISKLIKPINQISKRTQ